jgi:hypothetical protein
LAPVTRPASAHTSRCYAAGTMPNPLTRHLDTNQCMTAVLLVGGDPLCDWSGHAQPLSL